MRLGGPLVEATLNANLFGPVINIGKHHWDIPVILSDVFRKGNALA
jgi:hypothetical protein